MTPEPESPSLTFMSPRRLNTFVGRSKELRTIERWLKTDGAESIAVVGLGGIGKTTLVAEAIYRHKFDPSAVVCWLEGCSDLVQQLSDAAVAMGLAARELDSTGSARKLITVLMNRKHGILVVDDVDRPNLLHEPILEGPSLAQLGVRVAITSRFVSLPAAKTEEFFLGAFTSDEATRLLALKSGRDHYLDPKHEESGRVRELCDLLGHHPLAIVQAACLLRDSDLSLDAYISKFQHSVAVLETGPGNAAGYSLQEALKRGYDAIPDSFTTNLFNLLTSISSEFSLTRSNLPFLAGGFEQYHLARLDKALKWLTSLGFVHTSEEGVIAVHPLVREFGRSLQTPSDRHDLAANAEAAVIAAVGELLRGTERPTTETRPRVFLCYAGSDREQVENLHDDLTRDGFEPWMDKKSLLPGQEWELEVRKAIHDADFFIACVSRSFVGQTYGHKEIKLALEVYDTMPEGMIYVVPARLENVQIDDTRLASKHWVDLFDDCGYEMLLAALRSKQHE